VLLVPFYNYFTLTAKDIQKLPAREFTILLGYNRDITQSSSHPKAKRNIAVYGKAPIVPDMRIIDPFQFIHIKLKTDNTQGIEVMAIRSNYTGAHYHLFR